MRKSRSHHSPVILLTLIVIVCFSCDRQNVLAWNEEYSNDENDSVQEAFESRRRITSPTPVIVGETVPPTSSPTLETLNVKGFLLLSEFNQIMNTDVVDELGLTTKDGNRNRTETSNTQSKLEDDDDASFSAEEWWKDIVLNAWNRAFEVEEQVLNSTSSSSSSNMIDGTRRLKRKQFGSKVPFVVCSREKQQPSDGRRQSGNTRLGPMMSKLGIEDEDDVVPLLNKPEQTCHVVSTTASKAWDSVLSTVSDDERYYPLVPLIDVMKIGAGTIQALEDSWGQHAVSDKVISVRFAPGVTRVKGKKRNKEHDKEISQALLDTAAAIMKEVMLMVQTNILEENSESSQSDNRDLREKTVEEAHSLKQQGGRKLESKTQIPENDLKITNPSNRSKLFKSSNAAKSSNKSKKKPKNSLSMRFSSTSRTKKGRGKMYSKWERAFDERLESTDGCGRFFERVEIRPNYMRNGVYILLNYSNKTEPPLASELSCALSVIAALSIQPEILSVQVNADAKLYNLDASAMTQSGSKHNFPLFEAGLTGRGQIVGVSDTGVDVNSCYFKDNLLGNIKKDGTFQPDQRKIVQYIPYDNNNPDFKRDFVGGHGTHVSGTIAGNNNAIGDPANGVAYESKVAFYDFGFFNTNSQEQTIASSLVVDLPELFRSYKEADAKVQSISWGTDTAASYGWCDEYDAFIRDRPDLLVVVGAGNTGKNVETEEDVMMSIGRPGICKNVLTVGASLNNELASYSSKGPTPEGFLTKPDVIAPGTLLSAYARDEGSNAQTGTCNEDIKSIQGTSMAAPVVSGSAALIRQYFQEGWYPCGMRNCAPPINPSGSLLKAVLMNGASFLPGRRYDSKQNMGQINLIRSLKLVGQNDIEVIIVNDKLLLDGSKDTILIDIDESVCNVAKSDAAAFISVTLVWADPPAASLLNDLDLIVERINEDGQVLEKSFPNGLTTKDTINNAERVQEIAFQKDIFRVSVVASNLIDSEPQTYSLVITGCVYERATVSPDKSPSQAGGVTDSPTASRSELPSEILSKFPTEAPSVIPSASPSTTSTTDPSHSPSVRLSDEPSKVLTNNPSRTRSIHPSLARSNYPSRNPSTFPSIEKPSSRVADSSTASAIPTNEPSHLHNSQLSDNPNKFLNNDPFRIRSISPSSIPSFSSGQSEVQSETQTSEKSFPSNQSTTQSGAQNPTASHEMSPSTKPTISSSAIHGAFHSPSETRIVYPSLLPYNDPSGNPSKRTLFGKGLSNINSSQFKFDPDSNDVITSESYSFLRGAPNNSNPPSLIIQSTGKKDKMSKKNKTSEQNKANNKITPN